MARSRLSRARTSLDFHPGDRSVFLPLLFRSAFCRALPQDRNAGSEMSERNFFAELKRRNVYKVAVAYIVAGWTLSQGIAQVFPVFDISNWLIRLIVLLIIIGLPIALVLAWTFEITPQGIKRTEDVDPAATKNTKSHAWVYVVIIGALFSIGLFMLGRYGFRANNSSLVEPSAKPKAE